MDKSRSLRQTLTPEAFARLRAMFESASNIPTAQRRAFLEAASEGDLALADEVERMLTADTRFPEPSICVSCGDPLDQRDRFCRSCGAPTDQHASELEGRFRTGALVSKRFRIVTLLGRGGMGDVYRAYDLELDQPVALKFLAGLRVDDRARARLRSEVRLARQISHPNVCRVFDIGEADGELFLSMEYVDGEDLSSLLKRIGRLPQDKGVEIARKLCMGLAAAHAKGVLHRDLKPSNVMIDGAGEVRIMDFGLATIAGRSNASQTLIGTPAYMAPELLARGEPTKQSDIYSLGLVLHEIFTGQLPVEHLASTVLPSMPPIRGGGFYRRHVDYRIEDIVLRCLDPDAAKRPSSAFAVAAALPGGDPLAEALAIGETPSPDVVAAAGPNETLAPRRAVALLACVAAGLVALCVLTPRTQAVSKIPLEYPPEVLTEKARDIIRALGYHDAALDSASGFRIEDGYFKYMQPNAGPSERRGTAWNRLLSEPPSPISFWYRQSARALPVIDSPALGRLAPTYPAPTSVGLISIDTGVDGRLLRFAAIPDTPDVPAISAARVEWSTAFAAAGLDITRFAPAETQRRVPFASDTRATWSGVYSRGHDDLPVRIEAASSAGRPIYFEIVFPWTASDGFFVSAFADRDPYASFVPRWPRIVALLETLLIAAIALVAYSNWKRGRTDGRGTARLGLAVFAGFLTYTLLGAHDAVDTIFYTAALPDAVFIGALYSACYLALEPWVRRLWPEAMITWSRVIVGRWRDPVVARHVLIGLAGAVLSSCAEKVVELLIIQFGGAPARPIPFFGDIGFVVDNLTGWRALTSTLVIAVYQGVILSLAAFFILFLSRSVFKQRWLASLMFLVVVCAFGPIPSLAQGEWMYGLLGVAIVTTLLLVMLRLGLLVTMVWVCVGRFIGHALLTTNLTAWYGSSSLAAILVVMAAALWAFGMSIGGWSNLAPLSSRPVGAR